MTSDLRVRAFLNELDGDSLFNIPMKRVELAQKKNAWDKKSIRRRKLKAMLRKITADYKTVEADLDRLETDITHIEKMLSLPQDISQLEHYPTPKPEPSLEPEDMYIDDDYTN